MKKHFISLILFTILLCIFSIYINAEEVQQVVIEPDIVISADSVDDNVSYNIMYDAILDETILTLTVETLGVCIYDSPDTAYIDGIRFNGETVNSLKIPIDVSKENKLVVRTVYKDDFTGVLAQITDGTYDYTNLLKNPIGLFTVGYYILAIISVLIGIIAALKGKSKKVKTSEEIASAVDKHSEKAMFDLTTVIKNEVTSTLTPFFKSMTETQGSIIESIVLMNSKDPNSHLESLECLKKVASTDINGIIEKVSSELNNTIENAKNHKQHNLDILKTIAETTQEESADDNGDIPMF